MKFSQIAAGVRAERPVRFQVGIDEEQKPILAEVVLRPLSMLEEMDVEAEAIAECKAKGAQPAPTNSVYESARILAVLTRAVLDPESPTGKREPFFDMGSEQAGTLDPDILANLHAQQEAWQEECSPSYRHKTAPELILLVRELSVEADSDPFRFWRYSKRTQWSLALFMANMLAPSLGFSSSPGSSSPNDPEGDAVEAKSPTDSSRSLTQDPSPSDSDTSSEVES